MRSDLGIAPYGFTRQDAPYKARGARGEDSLDNSEEQSIMQLKRSLGDNRRNRIKEEKTWHSKDC